MPLEKQRSERSFGGSFSSLSISSILGFDDELDQDPTLSDFQQQSLCVFESEHMWAHFKAHLADKHIHTTAGVKAMLPEFVNDRVLDGSVETERHDNFSTRSNSSYGSSIRMDRQDSRGTRNIRSVYPAAMRRQESFGRNTTLYGRPRSRDGSFMSSYHEAIRGDAGNVISLYNSDSEADVNLLTSVSRRLSKMTSASGVPRNRSNSVFSLMSESKDLRSRNNSEMLNLQAQLSPMTDSSGSGTSRPKFRRPSTSDDEDIEHQLLSAGDNYPRRPSESTMQSECSREITGIAEEILLHVADQLEGLDGITNTQSSVRNVEAPKQFSYQPQRYKVDRNDNLQVRDSFVNEGENNIEANNSDFHKNGVYCKEDQQEQEVPSFTSSHTLLEPPTHEVLRKDNLQVRDDSINDGENITETNDSDANKNGVYCKDDQQEVPSFASSHTLLVEWGEDYSTSSDDEDYYDDGTLSCDSERAVMIDREDLLCSSHEEENSTPPAESKIPKSRRGMLMAVFSSLALEQRNKHA